MKPEIPFDIECHHCGKLIAAYDAVSVAEVKRGLDGRMYKKPIKNADGSVAIFCRECAKKVDEARRAHKP